MTTDLTKQDEFDLGIDLSSLMMMVMMVVLVQIIASTSLLTSQVSGLSSSAG